MQFNLDRFLDIQNAIFLFTIFLLILILHKHDKNLDLMQNILNN